MRFSQKMSKPIDIIVSPILLWGGAKTGKVLKGDGRSRRAGTGERGEGPKEKTLCCSVYIFYPIIFFPLSNNNPLEALG